MGPESRLCSSQAEILRAAGIGWNGPGDDLVWIQDVTGLAVNAVGMIDLEAFSTTTVIDHLIDIGGAEVLTRISVLFLAASCAEVGVGNLQVARLLFGVNCAGVEYLCHLVNQFRSIVFG